MTAKEESEKLMNALLPFTERMLKEHGEFYPHGGYMKPDGEIVLLGAGDPVSDHPKSADLIQTLHDSLRELARNKKCKASAIVFDIRLKSPTPDLKTDAIQVCLDHVDDYSVEVFFPYQLDNDNLKYGKIFAQKGKREIFE